ncbi:hypothetical protein [Nocardioides humi]|uniref:Phospholipase_D-nuclease N-terminal n=1 Tax=Nocardioides humi TaxID=449461 RepID=A0ABN2BCD3_9ACTN|nr:hypothetical protein [Nocardioides humi]
MDDWLVILAITVGLSLLAIVDMLRFRPGTRARAGQSRPLWIPLSVVLGPLGALLYATGPRLVLRRTVRQTRADARRGGAAAAHGRA